MFRLCRGSYWRCLCAWCGQNASSEIGTLGGYSTLWMARELPVGGELLTLEADPLHAAIARENLHFAGVTDRVTVAEGPALHTLENLGDRPPFDLVFIDADKPNNPNYLKWALHYARPGTPDYWR